MNWIKRKIIFIKKPRVFFIVFIFLTLLSNLLPISFFLHNRESHLLEISQNIILISCLVVHFEYRKQFIKVSNLFTFLIRQLLIVLLLYEELSFLTFNSNNLNNAQQEFNLHNSYFLSHQLFSIPIPTTNLFYPISIELLFYYLILPIFGYCSYCLFFKKFRYFFFEKEYAQYFLLYVVNLTLSFLTYLCSVYFDLNIKLDTFLIKDEVLESFFYLLLLIDTFKKRNIMSKKRVSRKNE